MHNSRSRNGDSRKGWGLPPRTTRKTEHLTPTTQGHEWQGVHKNSNDFPAVEAGSVKTSSWDETLPDANPVLSTIYLPSSEPDHSIFADQVYGKAVGDRPSFRYRPYSHSDSPRYSDSEDEEETSYDHQQVQGCITAFSNLIGRRVARAMVDLIGIEPHPGPGGKKKTKARTARQNLQPTKTAKNMVKLQQIPRGLKYMDDAARYMCVLSDPWSCEPVRLGGEMMQPSGIATLTYKAAVGVAGTFASFVFYPRSISPILYSATAAAPYTYSVNGSFSSGANLASIALGARVISAGVRISSVASSQSDNGIIVAGCLPRETAGIGSNFAGNCTNTGMPFLNTAIATQGYNEFNNYAQTEIFPIKDGFSCVYRPTDPVDFTFRDTLVTGPNTYVSEEPLSPYFVVGASGLTANTSLMVEYTVHLEYTVAEGFTGVVDQEMGQLTTPQLAKIANATFSDAANTATPGGKSTWSSKAWNFVRKAAPIAGTVLGSAVSAYSGGGMGVPSQPFKGAKYSLASAFGSAF